jgi:iron complex outermembrane receptor protein
MGLFFDINPPEKITVIKGASGLQYGGDAVGGIVVIDCFGKRYAVWKTILNLASNGRGGSVGSSLHKEMIRLELERIRTFKYSGDKEALIMCCLILGIREANFF